MTIKFEKIQAGTELYSKMSYRNNARRTVHGYHVVHIRSVDAETRTAVVSVNARTETWPERRLTRLSAKKPKVSL
jgi:hypothetical protein